MDILFSELQNLMIRLIIIFGVIFLDFLVVMTIRTEVFRRSLEESRYHVIFTNLIWAVLILVNVVFLQDLPLLESFDNNFHKGLEIDRLIWQNTDLQLVVMFYFSYMLKEKVSIAINLLFAAWIPMHYINMGIVTSWGNNLVALLGVILVLFCSWQINKHNDEWLWKRGFHLLSEVCFSASWGILLLPAFEYDSIAYLRFIVSFTFLMSLVHAINTLVRKQISYYNQVEDAAYMDLLTSVKNRNSFDDYFPETFGMYKQMDEPLSFAIMDIDHFKHFNDQYGHLVGDQVLKEVAYLSKEILSKPDNYGQIFRIGGEEFGFVFRNKKLEESVRILEEINERINNHVVINGEHKIKVSVSFGLSELKKKDKKATDLYHRVDAYLYHSKKNGRGVITVEGCLWNSEKSSKQKKSDDF